MKTDIQLDATLRLLLDLHIPLEKIKTSEHIKDFLKGNGILLVRDYPALDGSPWEGPIFQCFDPQWKARSAMEMLMIEFDEPLKKSPHN